MKLVAQKLDHVPVRGAKAGQLVARYGKEYPGADPIIVYAWGASGAEKSDARLLCLCDRGCVNLRGPVLGAGTGEARL